MYDLIIIGAGIAGMTASIYASRYGLKHLIFGENPGGQGNLAHTIENYPGIKSIKGPELMKRVSEQVENYGVKIRREKVIGLKTKDQGPRTKDTNQKFKNSNQFLVKISSGNEYSAKSLVLAMGATHRHLNIPGEEKFLGKGVSYCTTCDAPLFRDKVVAVVGGGNAALSGALHLASFVKKVYLIHHRDEFRAEKAWVEKLKKNKKIKLILLSTVKEVYGKEKVEGIIIKSLNHKNIKTKKRQQVDGLFIEVGKTPSTILAAQLRVELNEKNYVLVDANMKTNIVGVFAAGDLCLQKEQMVLCQFVAAAADGARAAASAYQFLTKKDPGASWGSFDKK